MSRIAALLLLPLLAGMVQAGPDRSDPLTRYQQALRLEAGQGKLSDAAAIYSALAAARTTPHGLRARALLRVASCRQALGDKQQAAALYRRVVRLFGAVSKVAGAAQRALESLQQGADLRLGQGLDRAGNHADAIALYDRRIQDHPKAPKLRFLRGASRYARGTHREALRDFDKALELRPGWALAYIWRGRTYQALGNLSAALDDLNQAVDLAPLRPEGYLRRGDVRFARRELPQAQRDYRLALTRQRTFYRAHLHLARAFAFALDDEQARRSYEAIVRDRRSHPEAARWAPEALTGLADLALLGADPAMARIDAQAALSVGARPSDARIAQEARRLVVERRRRARDRYALALKLRPGFVPALLGAVRLTPTPAALADVKKRIAAARPVRLVRLLKGEGVWGEVSSERHAVDAWKAQLEALTREQRPGPPARLDAAGAKAAAQVRAKSIDPAQWPGHFHREGLRLQRLFTTSRNPDHARRALRAFARAWSLQPGHGLALLEGAVTAAHWQRHTLALRLAERATRADPYLIEAWGLRGALLTWLLPEPERDPKRGGRFFSRAIEIALLVQPKTGGLSPKTARAYTGRAKAILSKAGNDPTRLRAARRDLRPILERLPRDLDRCSAAQLLSWKQSLGLLVKVETRLKNADGERRARAALLRVQAVIARRAREATKLGLQLRDRLDYVRAIEQFDLAIELAPRAAALYARGTCRLKLGNFLLGVLDFSRALELDPRIGEQVYQKVYQVSYVIDLERVIVELDKIVAANPDASHVVFLRGFFYVIHSEYQRATPGNLARGIADFDRCLALNPQHVTALLYRGFLRFKLRQYPAALADYERAAKLYPRSGSSHYLRALLWSVRKQRDKALAHLRQALRLGFDAGERIKTEKGFDFVRGDAELKALLKQGPQR